MAIANPNQPDSLALQRWRQQQQSGVEVSDDRAPIDGAVQCKGDGKTIRETAGEMDAVAEVFRDICTQGELVSFVLDEAAFRFLVVWRRGEFGRALAGIKVEVDRLVGAFRGVASQLSILERAVGVIDNLQGIRTNLSAAARIPTSPEAIAADPQGALDGYRSYFAGIVDICEIVEEVPGLGAFARGVAAICEAIPNAVENAYEIIDEYHDRLEGMSENARSGDYRFPEGESSERVAHGCALLDDIRNSPDIGYRQVADRVNTLVSARGSGAHLSPEAIALVRSRAEPLQRADEEQAGGMPLNIISNLAGGTVNTALRHLSMY